MVEETKPEVNDLIFKELIKRGYARDRRGAKVWNLADSKLVYSSPEQAKAYLDFMERSEYHMKSDAQELALMKHNIKTIKNSIKDEAINVIDLGCGNGKKAAKVIKMLKGFKIRYCPIDISSELLEEAMDAVRKENPKEVIKMQWIVSDFDNVENISKTMRYKNYQKNIFLLLGNTIENLEIHEILFQVRRAMQQGDILIIGNSLEVNRSNEMVKVYGQDSKLDNLLTQIPQGLGFSKEDIKMSAKLKPSRVEVYYTINKAHTIEQHENKIKFKKGDKLLTLLSNKYKKQDLMETLNMYFDEVNLSTSANGSYALAVCKK